MEIFDAIGRMVDERWRARGYDERAFAEVAAGVLAEMQPHRQVTGAEILDHFAAARASEPQTGDRLAHRLFVLHHGRRFHLSALFWIDQIATPHHHGFAGAFQVLEGSRIHCVYRFDERLRESARFQLGELTLRSTEILHRGDVRAVAPGSGFVHALCHVDRPSVSIVLETPVEDAYPTLDYHPPHVACAQHDDDGVLLTRLKVLEVLRLVDRPAYRAAARAQLQSATLHASFRILGHAEERADPETRAALLEVARARHGAAAELLARTFSETRRLRDVSIRRGLVRRPEHRFLLALLLYAPDRGVIDALVRARHPGADPAERIAGWMEELCATPHPRRPDENVLDLPRDEVWLGVLRQLLERRGLAAIRARLAEEYGEAEVAARDADLRELCDAIRGSPLLRPLFVEARA
jgi:hypothetical protein